MVGQNDCFTRRCPSVRSTLASTLYLLKIVSSNSKGGDWCGENEIRPKPNSRRRLPLRKQKSSAGAVQKKSIGGQKESKNGSAKDG
jgi:hypothetical protein